MNKIGLYILSLGLVLFISSCFKDLDTIPLDPNQFTSEVAYNEPESYKQVLAKLYAGLATTGQEGPAGRPDISGIDEGFSQYLRGYFYLQQLPTDETIVGWNDQTIKDFHNQSWTSSDVFVFSFYSRIFYQIALANEFLRETQSSRLDLRDVSAELREEIAGFRAEARFLRALSYWHALDLFRNVPFITENDPIGKFFPQPTNAQDLFNFIEAELLDIEDQIAAPRTNGYARADRAAVWMLLAKLYLNAEVYIGQDRYADCFEYTERVINAGFTLEPEYEHLFLADNDRSNEIIFPIAFDGINTQTFGGTTFIVFASTGGQMSPSARGIDNAWGGLRTTREFVSLFPEGQGGIVSERNRGNTVNYPKLYVPGTHQGNDPTDTRNSIAAPVGNQFFFGHKYFPDPNTEILFTRIPAPGAPFFGDNNGDGNLDQFGAPIVVPEAGLHYIEVDFTNNTYTIERRDWELQGSAVPGSEPVAMSWNQEERALEVELELDAGEITFIGNRDQSLVLGDNGGDGILELGGEPITKIEFSGTYKIYLYIEQPDYGYKITTNVFDRRGMFFTAGQTLDIEDVTPFTQGYAITKFSNMTSTGVAGSNLSYVDTDFPLFRLADAYLMAAEAALRGGGSTGQAVEYFNRVRERAYQGSLGNVTAEELTLDLILEERGRELYWECHRRTDLIRFGQFTDGSYVWNWKGGVMDGQQVPSFRNVYPIPDQDLNANPNLRQNEGY